MATRDSVNNIDADSSPTTHMKSTNPHLTHSRQDTMESSPSEAQALRRSKIDKERKIGHRRVGEGGEITYKKIQTSQIMGSIQLGIQHTVGSLASKPKRDLLMMDFWEVESITFPPEGSSLTPAHHYSEFRYKIYAPIAFRYFRDLFGIQPDDFMMSMCNSPLRELSNPGASGSIFYLTHDDEFIIKTVQHKEGEFLQKLLPGYYMNLNQNPRTLLPKFFGLYCLQTSNGKNIRLVVMNNLLPSDVKMHLKYDLKGSTFKRKASKGERAKKSPTYKDLDFMEHHPNGIFLEAETYSALIKTIQRDCTVLESFKIMDYSLLVGVHNLDVSTKEKQKNRKLLKVYQKSEESDNEEGVATAAAVIIKTNDVISDNNDEETQGNINRNKSNRQRLVAHSTAMESIQAESEPIDNEDNMPPGGIPARSEKGERLLLFVGIIDILQSYRLKKKLEHTFKSIIHDGETVSVCRPSFYAQRFQNFMAKTVFRKIPSPLKHSPSKRKSLSKAIQRSLDNENEAKDYGHGHYAHPMPHNAHLTKKHLPGNIKMESNHPTTSDTSAALVKERKSSMPPPVKQRNAPIKVNSGNTLKAKVPPPVPPRGSPRKRDSDYGIEASTRTLSTPVKNRKKSQLNNIYKNQYLTVAEEYGAPRFGDVRSPGNVLDWLELHDMFETNSENKLLPPPRPPQPICLKVKNDESTPQHLPHLLPSLPVQELLRRESMHSVSSTRSRTSHARLKTRLDLFQRQSSILSQSDRSSVTSIVRNFPPINKPKEDLSTYSPNRGEMRQTRFLRKREKRLQYLQYAGAALAREDDDFELGDNLLQSIHAFIEVKQDLEKTRWPRKQRQKSAAPLLPSITQMSPSGRHCIARGNIPSTISESDGFPSSCSLNLFTNSRRTTPSCSSTPPPAFDSLSSSSYHERKMNVGPAYRSASASSYKDDMISVSEIHIDTYLAVDTSASSQYGSRGGLTWTPPASGEGSTPTWTEGTPSFTESSSSAEFEHFSPFNSRKIDRYKPTVEEALNSLSSDMVNVE